MRLYTLSRRIDAVEQRAPKPQPVPEYDLGLLSDGEVDEMAAYSERVTAAGSPTDIDTVARLFNPAECARIADLLRKAAGQPETPAFIGRG